jgi:hypothetical protein
MNKLLALLLVLVMPFIATAQTNNYISFTMPYWASAVDSPYVNYYAVMDSFNTFWTGKELPVQEEEIFRDAPDQTESEDLRHLSAAGKLPVGEIDEATRTKLQYKEFLAFQYKRFKDWQQEVLPYVQPNGHILTQAEKEQIWNNQNQR